MESSEPAAAIARLLPEARWFAGKGAAVGGVEIADSCTVAPGLVLAIAEVSGPAGPARFIVPVDTATNADAACTPVFAGWLLGLVGGDGSAAARRGRFVGHAAGAPLVPPAAAAPVTPVGGDASNTSFRVGLGDRDVIVKLLRRPAAGIQPEVEVGELLARRGGWSGTPAFRGWLEYVSDAAGESTAVATVHDFLPGREAAWDFLLDVVTSGGLADRRRERILGIGGAIGAATAAMHAALAGGADVPAFAPEQGDPARRRRIAAAMADHAAGVFASLRDRSRTLPGPVAARLQSLAGAAATLVDRLRAAADVAGAALIRVHGDYHLGQILLDPAAPDGAPVVVDFEGEPGRPLAERRTKSSGFKDLAGMCRSFDYLLRCAARAGGPAHDPDRLRELERAYLAGYETGAAGRPWWPANPAAASRLLAAFKLDKAVYELAYELDHRPDWVEVPLAAVEEAAGYDAPPNETDRRGRPA